MDHAGMTQERFAALWRRCLSAGAQSEGADVYQEVLQCYSQPHRCYHTPDHIGHCLRMFDIARDEIIDADAVETALWFHDVVYCPRASDNELKSAEFFAARVGRQVGAGFRRRVHDLILVTMHSRPPADRDQEFMLDIDLSSFGLPWPEFVRDSSAVRKEFAHLSDREFYTNRIQFLDTLLQRPALYSTDLFRTRYEEAARRNIARHVDELRELGRS
jgi:predicted metal-dependent HD superfamily phosphohydrolase